MAAVVVALEIARAVALCQVGYVREVAVLDNSAVAASVTAVAAAVAVVLMIYWEHVHAIRASSLVSLYLTLTVLLEATKTYSLVNRPVMNVAGALTMTITVVKGILVVMQEVPRQLKEELLVNGKVSNEVTGGFWNRTLVFWINSTLFIGFRRPLKIQDLAHIGPDYSSEALADRFERFWVEGKLCPSPTSRGCSVPVMLIYCSKQKGTKCFVKDMHSHRLWTARFSGLPSHPVHRVLVHYPPSASSCLGTGQQH